MSEILHRLLIVEDNDADVLLIRRALEEDHIAAQITVCSDGEVALRLLTSPGIENPPDAIIMDLALPRVEGLDLLQRIRDLRALSGTPIMVFTSSPSPVDRRRIELLAHMRFVQKPSGLEKFFGVVTENVRSMFVESSRRKAIAGYSQAIEPAI